MGTTASMQLSLASVLAVSVSGVLVEDHPHDDYYADYYDTHHEEHSDDHDDHPDHVPGHHEQHDDGHDDHPDHVLDHDHPTGASISEQFLAGTSGSFRPRHVDVHLGQIPRHGKGRPAAPVKQAPPKDPYNCKEGKRSRWMPDKSDWCCEKKKICGDAFECFGGDDMSQEEKGWCCQVKNIGCVEPQATPAQESTPAPEETPAPAAEEAASALGNYTGPKEADTKGKHDHPSIEPVPDPDTPQRDDLGSEGVAGVVHDHGAIGDFPDKDKTELEVELPHEGHAPIDLESDMNR